MNPFGPTILIGSGAIGTVLRRSGEQSNDPVELLNLRNPAAVRTLHESYREAGSEILITNTFAANPLAMEAVGLAAVLGDINETGVRLARQVAGSDCPVWASVGPLSLGLRLDDFSDDDLRRIYAQQMQWLKKADALVLETFVDAREARAALESARALGLPVIFQIGNVGGGRHRWERIGALAGMATAAGVVAVGTNCQHPNEIVEVAAFLAGRTALPVTASANAGHPEISRGAVRYEFPPAAMRDLGERLAAAGCAVVGGCCGTTPEHIRALAAALRGRSVAARTSAVEVREPQPVADVTAGKTKENPVRRLLASPRRLISVEIRADRKRSLADIVSDAARIAEAGADMFDVPDNPGATVGRDAAVVAARLQDALELPAIPHKPAVHANLLQLHSSLLGAWDLGLRGLLALTGDPPSMGHLAGVAKLVADLKSSVEMLRLIRTLRGGRMINDEDVGDPPDFCAGCAVSQPTPAQFRWLQKKVDAGAEFVFSQPVFSVDAYRQLRDGVAPLGIRLFPGVMPLTSRKNAEFLAGGRIPGIRVPDALVEQYRGLASPEDQRAFGLERATELALAVSKEGGSLYLIMPFGRHAFEDTARIVRAVRAAG